MPSNPAARVSDPIAHASLMGAVLKFGTGLVATAVKTIAACKVLKWGMKAVRVMSAAASFTGAGIVVGLAGFALQMALEKGLEIAAEHVDEFKAAADSFIDGACPPSITGMIVTGSSNVIINGKPAAVAVISSAVCSRPGHAAPKAAEGSATVKVNNQPKHRKGDSITCGAKTAQGSPNVVVGGETAQVLPVDRDIADVLADLGKKIAGLYDIFNQVKGAALLAKGLFTCGIKNFLRCPEMLIGFGSAMYHLATGKPVNLLSGSKFLSGPEEEDFTLPARLPISWQR